MPPKNTDLTIARYQPPAAGTNSTDVVRYVNPNHPRNGRNKQRKFRPRLVLPPATDTTTVTVTATTPSTSTTKPPLALPPATTTTTTTTTPSTSKTPLALPAPPTTSKPKHRHSPPRPPPNSPTLAPTRIPPPLPTPPRPKAYLSIRVHPSTTTHLTPFDPYTFLTLPISRLYTYYLTLQSTLLCSLPSPLLPHPAIPPSSYTLGTESKPGAPDPPWWGVSAIAAEWTGSEVRAYHDLLEAQLQRASSDFSAGKRAGVGGGFGTAGWEGGKEVRKWREGFLRRVLVWEDLGQWGEARRCMCGGSGCAVRLASREASGAVVKHTGGGQQQQQHEPTPGRGARVFTDEGVMLGWPEEERWFDLVLKQPFCGGPGAYFVPSFLPPHFFLLLDA